MKDLTEYFIDLSKCTEDERKHIISLLPEPRDHWLLAISYKCSSLAYVQNETHGFEWVVCVNTAMNGRTELTYSEFIKLFEGGESKELKLSPEVIKAIAISHQKQMSSTHPHAIIGTIEDAIIEALETFGKKP